MKLIPRPMLFAVALMTNCIAVILLSNLGHPYEYQAISQQIWQIFIPILPFLAFGTITSALIAIYIKPSDIERWLPKNKLLASLLALTFGFIFPMGEYAIIPVVRQLFKKGLPVPVGIVFLLVAPIINPIAIADGYINFGYNAILIGQVLLASTIASVIGMIFSLQPQSASILVSTPTTTTNTSSAVNGIKVAIIEFFEFSVYLFLGSVILTLLGNLPVNLGIIDFVSSGDASIGGVELTGIILGYVSAINPTVYQAYDNVNLGSIIAMITLGAMIDMRSTILLLSLLKLRTIIYIIVLATLLTLLASIWINLSFV